ncbi:MAG TPA: citramalate synthase [Dehalococcoidia bacterium]|nr:citramalate synthase [Dehalococcoidia bacterium]
MLQIQLYDTTLRDGAQQEGISFSVEDKIKIARKLDELGIHFIEGGWPGSNPKDVEFFRRAQDLYLSQAVLCAFGSTRRPHIKADHDPNLQALVNAKTKVVTLVGKSWDRHVTQVLETTLEENLLMIADSIDYLVSRGVMVFFDAEHFFDGYKANADYALRVIKAADEAGAESIILCDTNGGSLPHEVASIVGVVRGEVVALLGIHAHNDAELAVANTLMAVQAGAAQVQGTINGYGERCGNANLCSIIPALKLKMGIYCLSDEQLAKLTEVSHYVNELANLTPVARQPYVGSSAFAHKGGLHVSGLTKWEESYQHIDPEIVGNRSGVLVSELSGVSNIIYKAKERGLDLSSRGEEARRILEQVKLLESRGFQYEGAEASFELLVRHAQPDYRSPFELVDFMVVVEKRRRPAASGEEILAEATVKVKVGEQVIHTASEGDGPVDALDKALRKALTQFYPSLAQVKLVDYKVRILDESAGTEAQVRVLIESSDGQEEWRTVGSSANIIEASWLALADSLEYWLVRRSATS